MKKILITGANSFVGTSIERWLMREPNNYQVDTVDTMVSGNRLIFQSMTLYFMWQALRMLTRSQRWLLYIIR